MDTATHLRLLRYGLQYHSTPSTSFGIFPPRPLANLTSTASSPATQLSYWLRPHTSQTRLPILYLHGIGVGLHPHVEFLHEQDRALNASSPPDDQVGILCLEVLQISSRLTTHPILPRSEFLAQLRQILDHHPGFDRFVLLSHSYGSVLSTHILTDDAMASRVAAALLVDPVTILLHMPDVAYNFTVRRPRKANEWQLWYFASKDPGVSPASFSLPFSSHRARLSFFNLLFFFSFYLHDFCRSPTSSAATSSGPRMSSGATASSTSCSRTACASPPACPAGISSSTRKR